MTENPTDELVRSYTPMARKIARRVAGRVDEDVEQVAFIGLVKAALRFDPAIGVQFSSFAWPTIEGEVKRHFRDAGWSISIGRSVKDRTVTIAASVEILSQELGRSPSITEITRQTGFSEDEVVEALEVHRNARPTSIDSASNEDDPPVVLPDVFDHYCVTEDRSVLRLMLSRLSNKHRQAVFFRFFEEMSQAEIAKQLGCSQMQVSRLLAQALGELRAMQTT
jgi:RNA polymerase sigma-B factor